MSDPHYQFKITDTNGEYQIDLTLLPTGNILYQNSKMVHGQVRDMVDFYLSPMEALNIGITLRTIAQKGNKLQRATK